MKLLSLCIFILILSNNAFSETSSSKFPNIELINCGNTYHSVAEILQCEENNFKHAEETLTLFFPKMYAFFPKGYQKSLDETQIYWKELIHSECQLISEASDVSIHQIEALSCLTQRYQQRLSDLIYACVLWENEHNYAQEQ